MKSITSQSPERLGLCGSVCHVQDAKIAPLPLDSLRDVYFAQRDQTNSLIDLDNSDRPGNPP
ncbi:MAG: hypothetical protein KGL35_27995 [Bradyrhizobium sp.]|nr:hypothetical protein [Pseudomonadota bacterium]MDE2068382.1 hypothetical protein [Bradyrhizobium sp.]MDE2472465.1 hypothetical protein [Bradyrhizobium sp.]